ncbi:MAG: hypothetical protein JW894_16725 [Bacteroidales bacterium]|nr:hypothetical protein [Bacteroidales bacterium]
MVTRIKKGSSKEEIQALFEELIKESSLKKGIDAYKFCGKVKFNDDGLKIQKRLRDEWK